MEGETDPKQGRVNRREMLIRGGSAIAAAGIAPSIASRPEPAFSGNWEDAQHPLYHGR